MKLMENYLTIDSPSGPMEAFVTAPAEQVRCPVIIVFQEAFGVNSHIKSLCRRLSEVGFLAIAPELYHRQGKHVVIPYGERREFMPYMSTLTNQGLIDDARAVINFLPELPNADAARVFSMGFCMGGFTSLLCATDLPLKGAISFYGAGVVREREGYQLKPFLELFGKIKCPVLLFYGEADASIPLREREVIENALRSNGKDFEIKVYPFSDHGFFCDERKVYDQKAASDAWRMSLVWLQERLHSPDKKDTKSMTASV